MEPLTAARLRNDSSQCCVRVLILDERHDLMQDRIFPVHVATNVTELIAMVTYRLCVPNPAAWGLYLHGSESAAGIFSFIVMQKSGCTREGTSAI